MTSPVIQFHRQRSSLDAGRPRVASLRCAWTFSSWLGLRRGKQTRIKDPEIRTDWHRGKRLPEAAAGDRAASLLGVGTSHQPLSRFSARPAQANLSTAHHAPFARARNTSEIVASPDLLNHHRCPVRAGRATYINRRHLLTAICVSWTIAVVAGVALFGALI